MADTASTPTDSGSEKQKSTKVTRVGRVVSDKPDKTVVVAVENRRRHPLYHKTVTRTSKFHAHDPENSCGIDDIVLIEESRPFSKKKRWVVREIVDRSERL